jgi:2'-5' RNA ligase
MGVIRAFIALDLEQEVLHRLDTIIRQLKQSLDGVPVRWVQAKNIHLTLKFLGDVSEANLPVLYKILENEAIKHPSFEVFVAELGAFPNLNRPRVIWVGVQAPAELTALQHNIDTETARLGYQSEERGFSPHLTLGRVSRNATPNETHRIGEALQITKVNTLGVTRPQAVHFYRSDLNPDGAIYHCLYSAPLRG